MNVKKILVHIFVIIVIYSICVVTNLPLTSIDLLNQQQIDFFENDTNLNVNGSLDEKYGVDKRSIGQEDNDGFTYLNVGVLMASHLGKCLNFNGHDQCETK